MGNYVENNLGPGETIIKKAEMNKTCGIVAMAFVAVVLLIIEIPIGLFCGWLQKELFSDLNKELGSSFSIMGIFAFTVVFAILIEGLIVLCAYLQYRNTELAITNKAIIGKTGILNTKSMNAPLDKVQNVIVEQDFLGKIINYGKITIETASAEKYVYDVIKDAEFFKKTVMTNVEKLQSDRNQAQAEATAKAVANAMNANNNNNQ